MRFDHVAVTTRDIAQSVAWYVRQFGASVLYQDDSWAFLKLGGTKLALVKSEQHPPHLALSVTEEQLQQLAADAGQPIRPHRDGTRSIYIEDPSGNAVELIAYPPDETAYVPRAG